MLQLCRLHDHRVARLQRPELLQKLASVTQPAPVTRCLVRLSASVVVSGVVIRPDELEALEAADGIATRQPPTVCEADVQRRRCGSVHRQRVATVDHVHVGSVGPAQARIDGHAPADTARKLHIHGLPYRLNLADERACPIRQRGARRARARFHKQELRQGLFEARTQRIGLLHRNLHAV